MNRVCFAALGLLVALAACGDRRFLPPTEATAISELPPSYALPVSCFETRPSPPVTSVGEPIVLDATCAYAGSEPIIDYDWELGDGRRVRGSTVQAVYERPGTYDVRLTVRDESGQQDLSVTRVLVR